MRHIGRLFLFCYRFAIRLQGKCFSVLISAAFADFGKRSVIAPPVRLVGEDRIVVGKDVFVGAGSWLQVLPGECNNSAAILIGDGTSIAGNCVISAAKSVILEKNVLVARNVYISDHRHRYGVLERPIMDQGVDKVAQVLIENGAWIGQNVVICPGVRIGCGAVIGANSVVNRDIPEYCVAAGSPARVVRRYGMRPEATTVVDAGFPAVLS